MLKRLEVVGGPKAVRQSDEIYLYRDGNWDRQFVLKQVGVKGECCVRCSWNGFDGLELLFGSVREARAEIDKLSDKPREWFEDVLRPARVVNG
jgi:tRNA U34 5-methylaminomethyl-2-thiouridine-forming methyltransferase MnmC